MGNVAEQHGARHGLVYAVGAYLIWGFAPVYFHQLAHVRPVVVLAHRVVWSVVLLGVLLVVLGRMGEVWGAVRERRTLAAMGVSTVLVAANWYLFIYTIGRGDILQASLGYFILPLVTCALGMVFLGERLRWWQWVSVAFAAVGVVVMAVGLGQVPGVALLLAGTFGSYGLVRKLAPVGPLVGTFVETVLLGPIAVAVILSPGGWAASTQSGGTVALLLSAGLITAIPLLLFTTAAKRLRLSTLGFCQYVGPSCQLLMAVAYGERFRAPHWIGFELVWAGLAVYSAGLVMASGARAEEVVPVTD